MKSEANLRLPKQHSLLNHDLGSHLRQSHRTSLVKLNMDDLSDVDSSLERYRMRNLKKFQESISTT